MIMEALFAPVGRWVGRWTRRPRKWSETTSITGSHLFAKAIIFTET